MRKVITLIVCLGFTLCVSAKHSNDTQLHMMQPDFKGLPYGIPAVETVKADIDRVVSFLEQAMPFEIVDGKLKQGSLRLTSYEAGVLYSAMQEAARQTHDSRYQAFVNDRLVGMAGMAPTMRDILMKDKNYDRQMRPLVLPHSLDDAGAMCAAYCRLLLTPGFSSKTSKDCKAIVKGYMGRLWKQYRIGDDKIYARLWPHYNTVWLDDMYMGVPSLAWYGALKNDTSCIIDAVKQVRAFKSRMWVELPSVGGDERGLFRHGWVEDMDPHPFFPWGRANGWAILTLCEVLDAMKVYESNTHDQSLAPYKAELTDLLRKHISGLCAVQDKSGLWHQLLDDPSSFLETSASAIFAYCLAHAICEGWINPITYGAQTLLAWNAVSTQINAQGQVENTVVGSGMGFDRAFYCHRPVHVMAAHGYGPVIWAGSEIIRMLGQTYPKMNDAAVHFYPTSQTATGAVFSEQR